jgi:hypothetical protein
MASPFKLPSQYKTYFLAPVLKLTWTLDKIAIREMLWASDLFVLY